LALAVAATWPAPARADPLRIVSFNLLHGGMTLRRGDGMRLEERLAMTVDGLRRLDADVIGLQEASAGASRGDVAARVAAALGDDHVRAPAGYRWIGRLARWATGFDEGPAIVTRLPIRATETIDLAPCGEWYGRTAICAVLDAAGGSLEVCSTHASGSACQLEHLATALLARRRDHPLVLVGDLNTTPDSAGVRGLIGRLGFVDAFAAAHPDGPGFTVWQPVRSATRSARRRVDYVLVAAGPRPVRVRESRLVLDAPGRGSDGEPLWPSDHYGVLAALDLFS
jgi:endonuclease/exonuclease/phosphatase family metal-dependent hydrolase